MTCHWPTGVAGQSRLFGSVCITNSQRTRTRSLITVKCLKSPPGFQCFKGSMHTLMKNTILKTKLLFSRNSFTYLMDACFIQLWASRARCLGANGSPCQSRFHHLRNALHLHSTIFEAANKSGQREQALPSRDYTRELQNPCETSRKRPTRRRGSADGHHLAGRQRDRHFKRRRSQHRTWEHQQRAASATQVPAARQWHLITSALPPLHHLDLLPSHFWLCWSNLASPRSHAAPLNMHRAQENFSRRSFRRDWWLSGSAKNH